MCLFGAQEGQKTVLYSLELKLEIVNELPQSSGNLTQALYEQIHQDCRTEKWRTVAIVPSTPLFHDSTEHTLADVQLITGLDEKQ